MFAGAGGKKNKQRERRLMKGMFDTNTSSNSKSSLVSSLRNTKKKALPPGTKIASPVAALTTSMTIDDDIENESDYGHDTYKELNERTGVNAFGNKHSKTPLSATTSGASALTKMVHLARRVGAQSALTKRKWGTLMEAAKTGSFLRTHRRGEQGKGRYHTGSYHLHLKHIFFYFSSLLRGEEFEQLKNVQKVILKCSQNVDTFLPSLALDMFCPCLD